MRFFAITAHKKAPIEGLERPNIIGFKSRVVAHKLYDIACYSHRVEMEFTKALLLYVEGLAQVSESEIHLPLA